MEAMATCLARVLNEGLQRKRDCPEAVVGKVALSVAKALEYLRDKQVGLPPEHVIQSANDPRKSSTGT
jgi:hypothetical protein